MQISQDIDIHTHTIKSYGAGEVVITLPILSGIDPDNPDETPKGLKQETLRSSAIIMSDKLISDWPPQNINELAEQAIQQLLELKPELVIFGTGARLEWPDRAILAPLMEAGIGFEVMDTAAACRTYNVLSYEGRMVAVALMMI